MNYSLLRSSHSWACLRSSDAPDFASSTIAASVVLAALNNLRPLVLGRRWLVAFCFGLIHGFGFASVLADLGLLDDDDMPLPLPRQLDPTLQRTSRLASLDPDDGIEL